jgi:hypothetical protein
MMPDPACAMSPTLISAVDVPVVCAFLSSHVPNMPILIMKFAVEKYRAGAPACMLFFVIFRPLVSTPTPLSCLQSLFSKISCKSVRRLTRSPELSWSHDRKIFFWFHIHFARSRRRRTQKYTRRDLIKELPFVPIVKVGPCTSNDLDERSALPLSFSLCSDVLCRPSLNPRRLQRLDCIGLSLRTAADPVVLHGPTCFERARHKRSHCGAKPDFRVLFFIFSLDYHSHVRELLEV